MKRSSINHSGSSLAPDSAGRGKSKAGLHAGRAIPFVLLFIAVVFILYPVAMLAIGSFRVDGAFSVAGYVTAFTSAVTYKALLNTLQMVLGILLGTWIIGGFLAFVRHKTDYKYKKLLDAGVFFSFTIPAYILSISWIELVCRGGYIHRLLQTVFPNMSYSINGYSVGASVFILTLHLYPLVYYGVGNALRLVSGVFEQSARVCGGKKVRIVFTVILPLVAPSFVSTGLLVVSRGMANFGVPAQLSSVAGKAVLTTRVFSAMSDLNLPVVAVLSLLLIVISLALYLLSERALKARRFNMPAAGPTDAHAEIGLGRWKNTLNAGIVVFFTLSVAIPFATILTSSFFKRWGLEFSAANLTFGNYVRLFTGENLLTRPLLNSLFFGTAASAAAAFFASLTVYFHQYRQSLVTRCLMHVAQLPIAVPNMILAVAAMFAWINEPLKLYGTGAIIIVTYTVLFTPICIKQMLGAAKNMDVSMDLAARTMGAGWALRYFRLFLPLMKNSLFSGLIVCFLISLKEIPISLLLYTTGTQTLGVLMFTIQSNSYGLEMTSAVSVVVIALSVCGNLLLRKLRSKGYHSYE